MGLFKQIKDLTGAQSSDGEAEPVDGPVDSEAAPDGAGAEPADPPD